jgi:hypothetical protein
MPVCPYHHDSLGGGRSFRFRTDDLFLYVSFRRKPINEALRLAKIDYLENSDLIKAHPILPYMNSAISARSASPETNPSFCLPSARTGYPAIAFLILFRIRSSGLS